MPIRLHIVFLKQQHKFKQIKCFHDNNISVCPLYNELSLALQLLKKFIHTGDTSCLRPLLSVTSTQDRVLLENHCHNASKRILCGQQAETAIREAVAYLSIAIMASGTC